MPGRLFLTAKREDVAGFLGVGIPPITPRFNMAPGEDLLVLDRSGASMMRWGIIPVGRRNARGRPVMETIVNARSETLFEKTAFEGVQRAVVPANGWYEWTGETRRKTAWRLSAADGGLLAFAAICDTWMAPGGIAVPQVATVTCPPNDDVSPIHHRMGVLLRRDDISCWLEADPAEAATLIKPWPNGLLSIEVADDVDWQAP